MERHAAQPLVAAQDVRNLHEVVVDHVGEVIRRKAVRLDQDGVAIVVVVERLDLPQQIHEARFARQRHSEADHAGRARRLQLGALGRGQGAAMPVVADGWLFARPLPLAQRFDALFRTITTIRQALTDQPLAPFVVERQPLRLEIRPVCAADRRAFVPLHIQPAQAVHDVLQRVWHKARAVGILDAQDEASAGVAGVKPVEQRGPCAAQVEIAGRAGCHAHAHGSVSVRHAFPFDEFLLSCDLLTCYSNSILRYRIATLSAKPMPINMVHSALPP